MKRTKEEKEPLSQEKKLEIYRAIGELAAPDDTPPNEVIKERFNGDEDAYLRVMASYHNIPLV